MLTIAFREATMDSIVTSTLNVRAESEESSSRSSRARSKAETFNSRFRATSVEVLQSSNATGAKVWSEEFIQAEEQISTLPAMPESEVESEEQDPFLAGRPELGIEDAIINKTEHETIEEQRLFWQKRMRHMARHVHKEEEGWKLYAKTCAPRVKEEDQLDVFARDVKWSAVPQLRSAAESVLPLEVLFNDLKEGFAMSYLRKNTAAKTSSYTSSKAVKEILSGSMRLLFAAKTKASWLCMLYRTFAMPW